VYNYACVDYRWGRTGVVVASHEEKIPFWYEISSQAIGWVGLVAVICVVGGYTDSIAHALAGHATRVSVNLTVTIAVSFVGVAACLVAGLRVRALNREKKRLSKRILGLETENEKLRSGIMPQRLPGLGPSSPPER